MNDPQNFIWLPLSVSACLVAALVCPNADAQSFYQQAQVGAGGTDQSAWQPPQAARTTPQPVIRAATNLAPLKPPRDIFTRTGQPLATPPTTPSTRPSVPVLSTAWNQFDAGVSKNPQNATAQSPAPQSVRFSNSSSFDRARPLGSSPNFRTTGEGMFDSINAVDDSDQQKFASANLEIEPPTGRSDFDAITSGATAKFGDVKDWVGEKTGAMLGGLKNGNWQDRISRMFGGADIKKIIGGLAVVIGGYLGLVWLLRMINPAGSGAIPREVLEVVGNAPLNSKQNLQLIRLGSKLMLMLHGPEGAQPIGEINDPVEVEQLLALCGGRGKRLASSVGAVIENRLRSGMPTTASPVIGAANQQSGSVSLSQGDSNNLTQLLRALEKQQGRGQLFEA